MDRALPVTLRPQGPNDLPVWVRGQGQGQGIVMRKIFTAYQYVPFEAEDCLRERNTENNTLLTNNDGIRGIE
jgi:hypothetical protein